MVLTVGAALMLRTLSSLTSVDPGFRTDHLLTMRLQPTGLESQDALRAYWRDVIGRVEEIPGVTGAATILHLPAPGAHGRRPSKSKVAPWPRANHPALGVAGGFDRLVRHRRGPGSSRPRLRRR